MDLPTIIVEFGEQRQRLKLTKFYLTINELLNLFSQTFRISFNLLNYEILLSDKRIHPNIKLDFTQLDNYQRFKIQSKINDRTEMNSLKQRLNTAALEITDVALLIHSIQTNYQNLIKTLIDEDNQPFCSHKSFGELSNVLEDQNLTVPPGFKSLSIDEKQLNTSPRDSQSTDEGIDRDAGSISIFESAHSDYELESIYLECREDVTIINEPNPTTIGGNNKLEWRNQPYRSRPQWNSNKVKYQSNYNKDQFGEKSSLKKPINPNKAPLPAEKKKNIPCKYAAGGNCKRGSQCRFIHVV